MARFTEGYRHLFGAAQSPIQLYTGFVAFFTGAAMGLLGILLVISGELLIEEIWVRNRAGILIAALGGPLIFMGLQLTLPSRFVIHAISGVGVVICLIAIFIFYQAWPHEWGPQAEIDRSGQVIGIYTIGLVLLFVTTAMALIVNFVSRHMVLPGQEDPDDLFADRDRPVTMDEVMRDIEREVSRQKLTWGGMEDDRLPREYLKLRADFGPGATVSKGSAGKVTETKATEMEHAFSSLARLRGVEGRETSGDDDTATAIDALKALRRARQVELEASRWYRFKRWLVSLFSGTPTTKKPPAAPRPREDGPAQEHPGGPEGAAKGDRNNPKTERGSSPHRATQRSAKRPQAIIRPGNAKEPGAKNRKKGSR